MAVRCDLLQREVKMPRIDHSHVYLENDRLKEDLDRRKENLDRLQYRQWMSLEEEINSLKKAAGLLGQEDLDERGRPIIQSPLARRRPQSKGRSQIMADQSASSNQDRTTNGDSASPGNRGKASSSRPQTRGSSGKSISVKLPQAELDLESVDGGFSDLDSDVDGSFLETGPTARNMRRPQAVLNSLEAKMTPRKAAFERPGRGRRPRRINIETLMESLRLKKYPAEWYSTVLEAADVPSRRTSTGSAKSTPMFTGKGRKSRPYTSTGNTSRGATPASRRDLMSRHSADLEGPPAVSFSTVVCNGHQTSKSKRELLRMVNQEAEGDMRPRSAVEQRLFMNKENSKLLDHKVKDFVKSIEEVTKRNRKKDILDQL